MNASSTPLSVLVAGGTGFLGAAIVRQLDDRGHRVTVLSRHPDAAGRRFPGRSVGVRPGDVTDPRTLTGALEGVDAVVQSVQFPGFPVEDPSRGRTFREVDARGTANVVEAAGRAGVQRVLYLSGVGADPDSDRPWFRAKAMAEAAVREGTPGGTVLRPSWVYGPEDRSLNTFARIVRLVPGAFPQLGDGRQRLNPVWIGDVAAASALLLESSDAAGRTVEIGGPVTYTMDAVLRVLMDALGRPKPIVHVPLWLVRPAAAAADLLPGQLFSAAALEFVTQGAVADLGALRSLLPDLGLTPLPEALGRYRPGRDSPRGPHDHP